MLSTNSVPLNPLKGFFSLVSFGSSIPTVFFPGIIDTLAEVELVFLARSSDKLIIFECNFQFLFQLRALGLTSRQPPLLCKAFLIYV